MDGAAILLALIAGTFFLLVVLIIILYILKSIGLYRMAKNKEIKQSWLAWIPYGDNYILGSVVKKIEIGRFKIPKLEILLPAVELLIIPFCILTNLDFILIMIYWALLNITLYKLYLMYSPKNVFALTILTIIFSVWPIFVFYLSDSIPSIDNENLIEE